MGEEDMYFKSKDEYITIEEVENGLMYVKKYFKRNFDGRENPIDMKYLEKMENKTKGHISKLEDMLDDPKISEDMEYKIQCDVDEMKLHCFCLTLIKEIAIVNNMKEVKSLDFINKRTLRDLAEKIMKYESPESYKFYVKDKLNEKYGDVYGSFYR